MVWHEFHSHIEERARDPAYLVALQNEGLTHERRMSDLLFPDAAKIPANIPADERLRRTIELLRSGVPAVLQGYMSAKDGAGVADVLELVRKDPRTPLGHIYRIGEFKRAMRVLTGHVMQISWYAELLQSVQGVASPNPFIVLGNGKRFDVCVEETRDLFMRLKSIILRLRASEKKPGAYLSSLCASCPWRYLCMDELVQIKHLSLIPGLGRRRIDSLIINGIFTWEDFRIADKSVLQKCGYSEEDVRAAKLAAEHLLRGRPIFREAIRTDFLRNLTVVAVEFASLPEQRREGKALRARSIIFEVEDKIEQALVDSATGAIPDSACSLLFCSGKHLAVYGGTDMQALKNIAMRSAPPRKVRATDVFEVLERFVHCPFRELDLNGVISYIDGSYARPVDNPVTRVRALRRVLEWLSGAEATNK